MRNSFRKSELGRGKSDQPRLRHPLNFQTLTPGRTLRTLPRCEETIGLFGHSGNEVGEVLVHLLGAGPSVVRRSNVAGLEALGEKVFGDDLE